MTDEQQGGKTVGHAKTYEEALVKDAQRFWSKVNKKKRKDGCWIWEGARNKETGRGNHNPAQFKGVPVREGRKIEQAHVWAWVLTHGNRPLGHGLQRGSAGIILRHICGNGNLGCVNPDHLRIGTQKENAREVKEMGRHPAQQLRRALAELEERNSQLDAIRKERDRMALELEKLT